MNRAAKVALLSALIVRPGHWDAECEAWAKMLPHDSPELHAQRLAEMVRVGEAYSLDLCDDQQRVGILVYSIDEHLPEAEFVIHAAYSAEGHLDLTAEFLPRLCAVARAKGCASVRFNTVRPALIEKAIAQGFTVSEVIMRKDVRHV